MIDKDLIITQQDLVDWIDRPPSNDDLDLCSYLSNAVKNQYEYKEEIDKLTAESTEWENKYYQLQNIIDELEKWLEERKTYYCMGCSHSYEDSLGKTRLVNEDIFNEITKIKDKLNELKGDNK